MKNLTSILHNIRRPKLLVGAAQMAANSYICQELTLPRLRKAPAVLLEEEAQLNSARLVNSARLDGLVGYSAIRHIEVLAVLICQSKRTRAAQPQGLMS